MARYGGLRCPSEVGAVTWGDVDVKAGRLTVRSCKTEAHEGHAVRFVPICPELRDVLAETWSAAAEGQSLVAPLAARRGANLRTTLEKVIVRAGHKPWPRLLQNLRASCATDWVERYPAHVVAKWLGHSPMIAATHYLTAREHHFADAVGGGSDEARRVGTNPARGVGKKPAPQGFAACRKGPQETQKSTGKDAENSVFPVDSSGSGMGDIGLEPMTPSLSS
ncbi:MAG: tyrosine-type recombinase/integrase [Planctomycetota bacterium]